MRHGGAGPDPDRAAATTARIVHAGITLGIVLYFAVVLYLEGGAVGGSAGGAAGSLRLAGYAALLVPAMASLAVRGRIGPRRHDVAPGEWWLENWRRAVAVWVLAETGGLAGITFGWVGGDATLLALAAGVAVALLVASRPGRLES